MSGGLWLLWKEDLQPLSLRIVFKASRFIACNITYLVPNLLFTAIFVYALARAQDKNEF